MLKMSHALERGAVRHNSPLVRLTPELHNWLTQYYLAVVRSEEEQPRQTLPPQLTAWPARLDYNNEGDYTAQIDKLQAGLSGPRPAGSARLSLEALSQNYRCNILLGRAGSGRTHQLRDLYFKMNRLALAQLEQAQPRVDGSFQIEAPLYLTIYLSLDELAGLIGQYERRGGRGNQFQAALLTLLAGQAGLDAPADLFGQVVPLILADNLERLEPAQAPVFFHKFNQWLGQTAPDARVIVSGRYINFALYHPWFRTEQQWQLYALPGFEWRETRSLLEDKIDAATLEHLELSGLQGLFNHPALARALYPQLETNRDGVAGLLDRFLEVACRGGRAAARSLAHYSRLLGEHDEANDLVPADALRLGIVETHPVTGATRLADPAYDRLLAAWACAQPVGPQLETVLKAAHHYGPEEAARWLKLLYLVTGVEGRAELLSGLLGRAPTLDRLEAAIEMGRVDPDFPHTWRGYLDGLLNDPLRGLFGQQLLKLTARLGQPDRLEGNAPSRPHLLLAETALDLLVEQGQADAGLWLEMGRVQEQLGRTEQAAESFQKAQREASLPALEGVMGIARLLTQSGQYGQACAQLDGVSRRLQEIQAEIDNQHSVVKRRQGDLEAALEFARRAARTGCRPAYRHNLALVLYEQGEGARAEEELNKLAAEFPHFAEGFYELGRLQSERGASESALLNLRRAVELSPSTTRFLSDLGRSLLAQGRYEEAYTYLRAGAAQSDAQPQQSLVLGLAALRLGRLDEARASFQRAIELAGDRLDVSLLVYLAAAEYAAHDWQRAVGTIARALDKEPRNDRLRLIAGRVAEAAGKLDNALAHYRTANYERQPSAPAPQVIAWRLGISRCLRLAGRLDEAQVHCEAADALQNGSPPVLFEAGRLALARKAYQDAAGLFGSGVAALEKLAEEYRRPELDERALDPDWLELFEEDTLGFELTYHYAEALRHIGQHLPAQKVLRAQLNDFGPGASSGPAPVSEQLLRRKAALHYQLGLNLLATGSAQEGLHYLTLASGDEPGNAHYRLGLAQGLLANGNSERAMYELTQARELNPTLAEVYAEMAELQLTSRARNLDSTLLLSCLNLYLKALESEPDSPQFIYRAALLAYRLRHQNQATELTGRLVRLAPEMADAHLLAACNLERLGDLERARAEIEQALLLAGTGRADCYVVAARLCRKSSMLGNMEKVLGSVKEREVMPLHHQSAICSEEGWLAMAGQRFQDAAERYSAAIDLHYRFINSGATLKLEDFYFEDAAVAGNLANSGQALLASYKVEYAGALRALGQNDVAVAQLDEAVGLNPQSARAHELRAELLVQAGSARVALSSMKLAAELEPTPARSYELGLLYLALEDLPLAIENLKLAGSSPEIASTSQFHADLGLAYHKAGNNSLARASYTRGLQIEPGNAELHLALARCYISDGERLAAVQPMQSAVVSEPNNPLYHLELARLYEELGWLQEAASEYEVAASLNPDRPATWLNSGQVLVKMGQVDGGHAALSRALELDERLAEAHYEIGLLYLNTYMATQHQSDRLPPDLSGMFGPTTGEAVPATARG